MWGQGGRMEGQVLSTKEPRLFAGIGQLVRNLVSGFGDILYPPHCTACSRLTGSHRALCPSCWSTFSWIEKPYCEVLGIPFSHNHGEGAVSALAIAEPPDFDRLRSVTLHVGAARSMVHGLKYRDRTDLAEMMGRWMARAGAEQLARAHLILPVPLHRSRLFTRRFNQSAELARVIARTSGITYAPRALLRVKRTERQVGLGQRARQENVRGAFKVTEEGKGQVFGRNVVLVDDVYTTGATVNAVARTLKRAGAADVTVLTFAMAFPEPI